MSRATRMGVAVAATAALLLAVPAMAGARPASDLAVRTAQAAPDSGRACSNTRIPVLLEVTLPVAPGSGPLVPLGGQEVAAKVCVPGEQPVRGVQLLVHGIGYDHRYWDVADPADPASDRYSWEAAAARAGFATVAIDRIGSGASSRPLSVAVTVDSNASAVHQVVSALRAGAVHGPAGPLDARRIVLVGHSYGSITSFVEASRYQDVDALLLTGVSHHLREVAGPLTIEGQHYPAALDPQFRDADLDPGYITTLPGRREAVFYAPGTDFDRRLLPLDDASKGIATQSELLNYPLFLRARLDVRVPVLLINGERDGLFCSQTPLDLGADCGSAESLAAGERPFYGSRVPSFDVHVTRGAGHVLNVFHSSQETFDVAMRWAASKV